MPVEIAFSKERSRQPMKYSICNWLFKEMDFAQSCLVTANHGFQGIEIAPFTLFDDPKNIGEEKILEIKKTIEEAGLSFVGFHAIFFGPGDFHISSRDSAIRQRSWDRLKRLVDIVGKLGGGVLVLGSPQQRRAIGISPDKAIGYIKEGLSKIAPCAAECSAKILIEALPSKDTNVINTLKESKELIRDINKPSIGGMFDFHNCVDETLTWPELIEHYFDIIQHVHLNEVNGSYPGTGNSDFTRAFMKLAEKKYGGWISLEIFHQPDDPNFALSKTMQFISDMEERIRSAGDFRQ
jgi:D-psicose/D-tagatose/L-ribulose 3-epimerase